MTAGQRTSGFSRCSSNQQQNKPVGCPLDDSSVVEPRRLVVDKQRLSVDGDDVARNLLGKPAAAAPDVDDRLHSSDSEHLAAPVATHHQPVLSDDPFPIHVLSIVASPRSRGLATGHDSGAPRARKGAALDSAALVPLGRYKPAMVAQPRRGPVARAIGETGSGSCAFAASRSHRGHVEHARGRLKSWRILRYFCRRGRSLAHALTAVAFPHDPQVVLREESRNRSQLAPSPGREDTDTVKLQLDGNSRRASQRSQMAHVFRDATGHPSSLDMAPLKRIFI